MAKHFCALIISLVVVHSNQAGDAPKRKPTPPTPRTLAILKEWERATANREDIQVDFQLLRAGPLQKTAKSFETGTLVALRADGTRIDLRDETGKPSGIYVWTGGQLRHFDHKTKVENVFAPNKSNLKPKLNPLAGVAERLAERMAGLPERFRFGLFGITAAAAIERFNVRLVREDNATATLSFEPLLEQDRVDVKSIEIILDKMDYRPSRADIYSVIGTKFSIVPTEFLVNRRPGATHVALAENLPAGWKRHFPLGGKQNAAQQAN